MTATQESGKGAGKVALMTGANMAWAGDHPPVGALAMTVLAGARDRQRGQQTAAELHAEGIDVASCAWTSWSATPVSPSARAGRRGHRPGGAPHL
jgi:hypothetical protein